MTTLQNLKKSLGNADIYLIDQMMKRNFSSSDKILDAGCGGGRNISFLINLGLNISGCDIDSKVISDLTLKFPENRFDLAPLDNLPYSNHSFNYVICNAVLHFADSNIHFFKMVKELNRVLVPSGILFIRMTSIFGIEHKIKPKDNHFILPDGSQRFLLNNEHINNIKGLFTFIEPLKTVNVNNLRCMSTLILKKKNLQLFN